MKWTLWWYCCAGQLVFGHASLLLFAHTPFCIKRRAWGWPWAFYSKKFPLREWVRSAEQAYKMLWCWSLNVSWCRCRNKWTCHKTHTYGPHCFHSRHMVTVMHLRWLLPCMAGVWQHCYFFPGSTAIFVLAMRPQCSGGTVLALQANSETRHKYIDNEFMNCIQLAISRSERIALPKDSKKQNSEKKKQKRNTRSSSSQNCASSLPKQEAKTNRAGAQQKKHNIISWTKNSCGFSIS